METEKSCYSHHGSCSSDALYGVGVIGAAVYFVQGAAGFGPIVVAIIKSFFWPAFVVFKLLGMLSI